MKINYKEFNKKGFLIIKNFLNKKDIIKVSSELNKYNFYKDNNVFNQLIHFTQGDSLPFIFQSDEDNFMPDQFALCRFGNSEFKMNRDSLNTYKYSISVLEEF